MGCCLIHESLTKANKVFKIYPVEFCFLTSPCLLLSNLKFTLCHCRNRSILFSAGGDFTGMRLPRSENHWGPPWRLSPSPSISLARLILPWWLLLSKQTDTSTRWTEVGNTHTCVHTHGHVHIDSYLYFYIYPRILKTMNSYQYNQYQYSATASVLVFSVSVFVIPWDTWTCRFISFIKYRKFLALISSNILCAPFSFSLGTLAPWMEGQVGVS